MVSSHSFPVVKDPAGTSMLIRKQTPTSRMLTVILRLLLDSSFFIRAKYRFARAAKK